MKKTVDGPKMVGRPTLRERGWTDTMINRFLGEPDKLAPNPHYKCAAPRRLYLESRVVDAESSGLFRMAKRKAQARQRAAGKAVATKRKLTAAQVEAIAISVPRLTSDALVRRACDHYNWRKADREIDAPAASPSSDRGFLDRITVNYLRHRLTEYEAHLHKTSGRVGASDAYVTIKAKVLEAIAAAYPDLADECRRQISQSTSSRR